MSVSIVFARCVREELQRRGIDPEAAFARAGVDPARLDDLRDRVSFAQIGVLCAEAAEASREPAFGLQLGASVPLHMLQLIGHLLLCQPSLQAAVSILQRFSGLLADDLGWQVKSEGDDVFVRVVLPRELPQPCVADFALTLMAQISRGFSAPNGPLLGVRVRHPAPPHAARYEQTFACPVYFEQSADGVLLPRAQFERKQAHADHVVGAIYERYALDLMTGQRQAQTVTQRVQTLLRLETRIAELDATRVARQLGMGLRTLRRRLTNEGTSLRRLLDHARSFHARQRLRLPNANIKQVAAELGFSDPTAFHRAFRRWTGVTPAAFASGLADESPASD